MHIDPELSIYIGYGIGRFLLTITIKPYIHSSYWILKFARILNGEEGKLFLTSFGPVWKIML